MLQNVKSRSRDLDLWPVTLILILHNIVFEFYLQTKFGEKIFIGYKDIAQNVGWRKKTIPEEKKTEKKNPRVKQYVAK